MNLINDAWIPVIRNDGTQHLIAPWQMVETENPVIEINAPRADFQGALYQFLIGLLQTCFAPEDEDEWMEYWEEMPDQKQLRAALENKAVAFVLENRDGASFMQEHPGTKNYKDDFDNAECLPIEDLIGGALSDNTRKGNKDLFVKSKTIQVISPYMAALGLFNMQITGVLAWGKHRVGLRGNAPLTTLLKPANENKSLWHKLWLNVIYKEDYDLIPGDQNKNSDEDIFPWLKATPLSVKKEVTSPIDASALHHYWPMPRRIKLIFEDVDTVCDLTGVAIKKAVRSYQRVPNGIYYSNGWVHPLTPYTRAAKDQFPKPIEGRIAGEGFKQWVSLNYDEFVDDKNIKMRWGRSLSVKQFYDEKNHIDERVSLWCFGYDASNANVRCWYESIMPTFQLSQDEIDALKSNVSDCLQIAHQLNEDLYFALIRALFKPQRDSSGKESWKHITKNIKKSGHLSSYKNIHQEYWAYLETLFPTFILELIKTTETGRPLELYSKWVNEIQRYCLKYFDQYALNNAENNSDMKRVIEAKNYLLGCLYPRKKGLLKEIIEHQNS